jgi:hypothetical protein
MSAESEKSDHHPDPAGPGDEPGQARPAPDSLVSPGSPGQPGSADVLTQGPASSGDSPAGWLRAGGTSAGRAAAGHADRWGAWAVDPIRRARSIGPLSSLASLGPRLRSRRPVIVAGIAVVGLLGGAGAALATTGSGAPGTAPKAIAATPSPGSPLLPGQAHRMFGHGFRGLAGPMFGVGVGLGGPGVAGGPGGGALHGQFVMAKPGGGYQTVDIQNGKVTAVSATSITLRSSDGYSHTYAITSSTLVDAQRNGISSVKAGHQVSLTATVSGSTATAVGVLDRTLLQQGRQAFGFGGGPGWAGRGSLAPQAG